MADECRPEAYAVDASVDTALHRQVSSNTFGDLISTVLSQGCLANAELRIDQSH